jgi:hypothetical protein
MAGEEVIAFHTVFCSHGFWLPNDPRGSQSTEVRAENLRPFGPATKTEERCSVAAVPHDFTIRRLAKESLVYPEVAFDGQQALSVGRGFKNQINKSGYLVHACAILPSHIHRVIRRHHYPIEQVVRLLRQSATTQLLADGQHPFAEQRTEKGRLPSVWAQGLWKVFLSSADDIRREIRYAEENPLREGKPRQHWSFIVPFEG